MKKNIYLLLIGVLFIGACSKSTLVVDDKVAPKTKGINLGWTITFSSGHEGYQCGWHCFAYGSPPNWNYCHMPCWLFGNLCTHTITIGWTNKKSTQSDQPELNTYYDVTVVFQNETISDTLQVIPFYNRSISPVETKAAYWLNIPSQLMHAIPGKPNAYTMSGLYFTENQVFAND